VWGREYGLVKMQGRNGREDWAERRKKTRKAIFMSFQLSVSG
jgi:ribosomal protein L34